ncbi:SEC-C metal-binding domain-containing protein [Clostridium rectalis]|uniref:SEC-C metal-binding domain-containing protein n=1 Tax=Clostridium rectalis TaxID=2040295 RepID=UPI000F630247|nr:SEC-C metal-binding domain-containing protein [Clostridium rectalis]
MSLYNEWKNLVVFFVQTRGEEEFWKEYGSIEGKIVPQVLKNYKDPFKGKFNELAKNFNVSNVSFMGFLDGVNSSLKKPVHIDSITEDSEILLDIDFEKLYIAMLQAGTDNLYTLPEWNIIFGKDKLTKLNMEFSNTKTVLSAKKVGRNDLCPCGSGKKYKNCCANNA